MLSLGDVLAGASGMAIGLLGGLVCFLCGYLVGRRVMRRVHYLHGFAAGFRAARDGADAPPRSPRSLAPRLFEVDEPGGWR